MSSQLQELQEIIPPLEGSDAVAIPYLIEAIAFLLTVVLIVPLCKKLRISPVLGYLGVGAAIGPYALSIIKDVEGVRHLAELGVIFLLFTIGLELSFDRLRSFARMIFGLGTLQLVLSTVTIGGVAWAWGNTPETALIIGLCLSLSSTAIVMQVLGERGEAGGPAGRTAFAVLLLQDLAVVPILILLPILGGEQKGSLLGSLGLAVLKAGATIALLVFIGRYPLRFLFRTVAYSRSVDVFTGLTLLTVLATSLATGLAGLSMALGAFLAGLLLAETEFRHQVESEMEPFKGLLLGLFFMSVGMNLDFTMAFRSGLWVLAAVIGLLMVKMLAALVSARLLGIQWPVALRVSLLLAGAGEFAFVVIGQASLSYDLIGRDVAHFMAMVAGLSMVATPLLASLGRLLERRIAARTQDDAPDAHHEGLAGHVIIAGFGRVGRSIAAVLKARGIPYVALDARAKPVRLLRERGEPVFVGDASKPELLRLAGAGRAAALLITMDNANAAAGALTAVRRHWPHLPVLVRSRDHTQAEVLLRAGATRVVPETLEASLQLAVHLLQALGYPRDEANACVQVIRRDQYRLLQEANSATDVD
jgi:monovalent cation:proton antiporter-2 (CPA2) family protein